MLATQVVMTASRRQRFKEDISSEQLSNVKNHLARTTAMTTIHPPVFLLCKRLHWYSTAQKTTSRTYYFAVPCEKKLETVDMSQNRALARGVRTLQMFC